MVYKPSFFFAKKTAQTLSGPLQLKMQLYQSLFIFLTSISSSS